MQRSKILRLAKGFRGRAKNCVRVAKQRVERALQYATRDRRAKKRDFRGLWIARIQAGAREHGVSFGGKKGGRCDDVASCHKPCFSTHPLLYPQLKYSWLISSLKADNVALNRRTLADLAAQEPASFAALCARVRAMRGLDGAEGAGRP